MKHILLTLLLASCTSSEYMLKPGKKFVDGEMVHGKLRIQSRKAEGNELPEIVLFQDGTGHDFTIYEQSAIKNP